MLDLKKNDSKNTFSQKQRKKIPKRSEATKKHQGGRSTRFGGLSRGRGSNGRSRCVLRCVVERIVHQRIVSAVAVVYIIEVLIHIDLRCWVVVIVVRDIVVRVGRCRWRNVYAKRSGGLGVGGVGGVGAVGSGSVNSGGSNRSWNIVWIKCNLTRNCEGQGFCRWRSSGRRGSECFVSGVVNDVGVVDGIVDCARTCAASYVVVPLCGPK